MAARLRLVLTLALGLPALGWGCAGGGLRNPFAAVTEVDVDDERSVGAQVDEAIRAQIALVDDPVVLGFIQDLGQRIVAGIEPQPFIYRFRVIEDPNLNAFALPGGYIYLHSGTILEAATLNELAGVVGHEVAHVKARHYARGTEQAFWPSLLARAAGLAGAFAAGAPELMAAAEGVNVALQLKYTREFEAEADDLGAAFMARAGFDPAGMGRFFERIIAAEHPSGIHIPPYLYSHPDLEDRLDAVHARGDQLSVTGRMPPELLATFRNAQARLALLIATDRTRWTAVAAYDRAVTDPLLQGAEAAVAEGRALDALPLLRSAEQLEPRDPRPSFRRAEILQDRGRTEEAISAYRRALALDPSVALAWHRLGTGLAQLGSRHSAVYCFEQAERRFTPGGALQERTRLSITTLTYPPVTDSGLRPGRAGLPLGKSTANLFRLSDGEVVWWARLDSRYDPLRAGIQVVWTDPKGRVVQEENAEANGRHGAESRLDLAPLPPGSFGIWRVKAVLGGQVIHRQTFHYVPGGPAPSSSSR